ncbi:hypothetical protein PMG11_03136 [Penicillium brasilianum]|uniref:Uncharacterized protein n=1 Tax=Penicillium brasilianum TaxID=104259 RepID=A0A0F7VGN5_PENBI|nr:hypothetical protein PMG11_03136 [Penicillium brasilianum]
MVIIDSSIWDEANPAVSCGEECVLVLPPYPLPTPSVVTFDEGFETVLNVAWETPSVTTLPDGEVKSTNGITHILQTTTITLPHMTVDELHLWPVTVPTQTTKTTIYAMVRFPPQTLVITDDPNPVSETGGTHSPVTRSITIPPYPWNTESASDSRVKPVTYTSAPDKKNGPPCINRAKCDIPCLLPIFCHGPCVKNCGGGGFAAFNDPHPLPNPEPGPDEDPDDDDDDDDDCTQTATVTDEWVSCKTIDSTSTSCTTTSYHVHIGCRATASATTTGVDACYSVDPYEDQGEDGGVPSGYVTTTDDRRITTTTREVPSTTTQRPEQTHTVDGGVLKCMSDNNDYKQGDQDHFATLDHFNSVARDVCRQEQVNFASDTNGNYGMDYGRLDTPTKPLLFFDIRKVAGNNCPPFPDFSAQNHNEETEMCLQRFATIINSCDTAANGHDYWKQGGTFTKVCMQWSLTPLS